MILRRVIRSISVIPPPTGASSVRAERRSPWKKSSGSLARAALEERKERGREKREYAGRMWRGGRGGEGATTISPHNRVTAAKEEERGVFATVEADRSAGHSNTEFPVWHFTKPFEQDGA